MGGGLGEGGGERGEGGWSEGRESGLSRSWRHRNSHGRSSPSAPPTATRRYGGVGRGGAGQGRGGGGVRRDREG